VRRRLSKLSPLARSSAGLLYFPEGNQYRVKVWNDKGGQRQEKTEWHRIVLWGKQAESLQEYLTKGKQINIPAETPMSFRLNQDLRLR